MNQLSALMSKLTMSNIIDKYQAEIEQDPILNELHQYIIANGGYDDSSNRLKLKKDEYLSKILPPRTVEFFRSINWGTFDVTLSKDCSKAERLCIIDVLTKMLILHYQVEKDDSKKKVIGEQILMIATVCNADSKECVLL